MNEQAIRDILSGRRRGVWPATLRGVLAMMSLPYGAAMRVRRWAYRCGMLKSHPAAVPVICVGNLTTGGTGKTPTVVWVVRRLKEAGHTPVILTRGYKAVAGRSDEAELLKNLTGAPVVMNPDRVAGAASCVQAGADVIVMDDGYQHRRLRRDLDIVLINATSPLGYGWCLPRGLLREPPAALADAHALLITHSNEVPPWRLEALRRRLARLAPEALTALAVHKPVSLINAQAQEMPLEALAGRKVFAFCGLGSPEGFFAMLSSMHARLVARRALDDHVEYTPELQAELSAAIRKSDASLAVTTRKDHVKLAGTALGAEAWQLAMEIDLVEGPQELLLRIFAAVKGAGH